MTSTGSGSNDTQSGGRSETPGRRLRDALEPVAAISFYSDPALEGYASFGLDFPTAYPWMRSCVLGEASPSVVAAAFGVWEPGLIRRNLETARAAASRDDIREAAVSGASAALHDILASVDIAEIRDVELALRRSAEAADYTARALFAGLRGTPWPRDSYAGLWHAAMMWREYRGDSHLAACVAANVSGIEANLLTELQVGYAAKEYAATRGWSDEQLDDATARLRRRGLVGNDGLTAEGRAFRQELERVTDAGVSSGVDALGADLDRIVDRAEAWSQLVIDRGWFPQNVKKRLAG